MEGAGGGYGGRDGNEAGDRDRDGGKVGEGERYRDGKGCRMMGGRGGGARGQPNTEGY